MIQLFLRLERALGRLSLAPLAAVLLGCLGSVAHAQTFVVDDSGGPGVDFVSIQEAVNAVPAGAVLLVRDGDYDGFTMDKALTIIGDGPNTRITGPFPVQIVDLVSTRAAVITRLTTSKLRVTNCQATVVLDELVNNYYGELRVTGCADVRCSGLQSDYAAVLLNSRVQLTRCSCSIVWARGSSVVHVSNSVVVGFEGEPCETTGCLFDGTEVPDGGDAIFVEANAYLRFVDSVAVGGSPGYNICGCSGLGSPGRACVVRGFAEIWNTRAFPGGPQITVDTEQAGAFSDQSFLPSLDTPGAGSFVGFEVSAPPGASARFLLGRGPALARIPGSTIERLVQAGRVASLGQVPPSGAYSFGFQQSGLAPGTVFWAQTSVTFPGGQTEMSNAVAFIVRE